MAKKRIECEGKTVQEATEKALLKLNVNVGDVDIEILEEPAKGFWGIGTKPARVAVTTKGDYQENDKEQSNVEIQEEEDDLYIDQPANDDIIKCQEKYEAGMDNNAANVAVRFLKDIFDKMNISVDFYLCESDEEIFVDIKGDDVGIIIGRRGETLDSLQYLTGLAVSRNADEYKKVVIDVENYRKKREESLVSLAYRMAGKVKRTRQDSLLEPMNSYERKIIHSTLQDDNLVRTYSVGKDDERKVVITLK